jgi:hypothetical protein
MHCALPFHLPSPTHSVQVLCESRLNLAPVYGLLTARNISAEFVAPFKPPSEWLPSSTDSPIVVCAMLLSCVVFLAEEGLQHLALDR